MDWLANILTSPNAALVLGVLVILVVILAILARIGLISFNGKGLRIGLSEQERTIIRRQLEHVDVVLDATFRDLPKTLQNDHGRIVISKVKDQFERMIVFNHITLEEDYIEQKQELILATVLKFTTDEYFTTEKFKHYLYELVEKIIRRLVKIRKNKERD